MFISCATTVYAQEVPEEVKAVILARPGPVPEIVTKAVLGSTSGITTVLPEEREQKLKSEVLRNKRQIASLRKQVAGLKKSSRQQTNLSKKLQYALNSANALQQQLQETIRNKDAQLLVRATSIKDLQISLESASRASDLLRQQLETARENEQRLLEKTKEIASLKASSVAEQETSNILRQQSQETIEEKDGKLAERDATIANLQASLETAAKASDLLRQQQSEATKEDERLIVEKLLEEDVVKEQTADDLQQQQLPETIEEKGAEFISGDGTISNPKISIPAIVEETSIPQGGDRRVSVIALAAFVALCVVCAVFVVRFSKHRANNLRMQQRMQQNAVARQDQDLQLAKDKTPLNADFFSLSKRNIRFIYRGESLNLKVVGVEAPCGVDVKIKNMASHIKNCVSEACANVHTSRVLAGWDEKVSS